MENVAAAWRPIVLGLAFGAKGVQSGRIFIGSTGPCCQQYNPRPSVRLGFRPARIRRRTKVVFLAKHNCDPLESGEVGNTSVPCHPDVLATIPRDRRLACGSIAAPACHRRRSLRRHPKRRTLSQLGTQPPPGPSNRRQSPMHLKQLASRLRAWTDRASPDSSGMKDRKGLKARAAAVWPCRPPCAGHERLRSARSVVRSLHLSRLPNARMGEVGRLEATPGIEPGCTDLQSGCFAKLSIT